VTLQGDAIPLADALAELTKQTQIVVADRRRQPEPRILKLNLKDVLFWQALDAIARQAGARVSLYQRDGVLALVEGPPDEWVSYSGPFRIALKRLTAVEDLETVSHYQVTTLEVAWEPPVRPFLIETRPRSLVVQDDQGRDLPVPDAGAGQAPVEAPLAMLLDLRLPAAPRSSLKLAQLRGTFSVIAAAHMLTFTFDTLDVLAKEPKAGVQTQEGVTVRVSKLSLAPDLWTAEMTLEYPANGPAFETYQSWLGGNEIYLQKGGGTQRFPNNGGYALETATSNRATVSYHFIDNKPKQVRGPASDWQLVYRTPSVLHQIEVPFAFKDVRLP
jgi:hypothetical protein